jgi:Glu-tRNA(Gln) amidotransferase subunit E-like FAD-binding protein
MITDAELEKELRKIVEQSKGAPIGALMGIAMSKFRGKASGQKIAEILKKLSS